jgi:hypothetical protein
MQESLAKLAREVDDFLMGTSKVHKALVNVTAALDAAGIDFALMGGLALGEHGHVRLTVDVDILITADGLRHFKATYLGRGFVEKFPGSRGVRDTETGVSIDFVVAGHYPGDGNPKPVRFPVPTVFEKGQKAIRLVDLRSLVELKLASGQSAAHRIQDLADVVALIRANGLAQDFASQLDASVRDKYIELWRAAQVRDQD